MEKEKQHFYFIIGIMFILMGIFSLFWGVIIPTLFTRNDLPQLIFYILGIVLIILGSIISILLRKGWNIEEMEINKGGLD